MSRFRSVSEADVEALADHLGLEFAAGEAADAADRLNTLADIYADFEAAPVDAIADRGGGPDLFETDPRRPTESEDSHNAWITRFDLTRPETDGGLADLDVAVKDNMCVRGVEMTCGSRAFEGFVPGEHAEVVERVLDAGGRIVGKTNMDELAFGPTSETSAFGPTANPADAEHVAGGSSSGSASAVAAGDVDLALGSDTGGSVRIPASYCGIVGIKPTYGRVPFDGVAELAFSMDHVGTLARDVETAARGLGAIADPASDGEKLTAGSDLGTDPSSLTVGVEERFFEEHVSEGVERTVRAAIDALADAGATVEQVDIPALDYSREGWWGLAPSEFAAAYATDGTGLWRRTRVNESLAAATARVRRASSRNLGTNVKEMLALGEHLNTTQNGYYYVRAQNYRAALRDQFDDALADVDALVTPSTPTTALEIGGFERGVTPPVNWDTHPTNLTGHPSVSVPCGDVGGLPVGLQFVGPWHDDAAVIDAAYAYERRV